MAAFERGRQRTFLFLATIGAVILFMNLTLLTGTDVTSQIKNIPIHIPLGDKNSPSGQDAPPDPGLPKSESWHHDNEKFEDHADIEDEHPIAGYMKKADELWRTYEEERSSTFKETVDKYRRKYGRHPPPGFRDWYKFARDKGVHNVDDFDQIMDDLRPFWGIEPSVIRSHAAHLSAEPNNAVSGFHIRDKKIWKITNDEGWRVDTFKKLLGSCVKYLPDMDIAMNRLDQPRLIVPWTEMQALLKKEIETRRMVPDAYAEWTTNMTGFLKEDDPSPVITDPKFFNLAGQQYMDTAKEACPPESHARGGAGGSLESVSALYKDSRGGFITNFNRSSDLCTVGPEIQDKHGFLFASSTTTASKELLPIFGECKVNVNNDILFPANMYYTADERYTYNAKNDVDWDDKHDVLTWRGVTSGGTFNAENWKGNHRNRLAMVTNATMLADQEIRIMTQDPNKAGSYQNFDHYNSSKFAAEYTDVGFTEGVNCVPNCSIYDDVWTYKKEIQITEQFKSKFLVDVDGASFSGRWRAFLQSKSLGIKSTIFREWHDTRLIPWRHFVPLDNRYDELYSILTYFIGLGKATDVLQSNQPYVQRHDFEGRRIANQGREWAAKVLRNEDIEIYMFRLLLEYARIIDDNRDRIGYSGDGTELDKYDAKLDKVDAKHPWSASGAANGGHV